jgi:hypothetical protein
MGGAASGVAIEIGLGEVQLARAVEGDLARFNSAQPRVDCKRGR